MAGSTNLNRNLLRLLRPGNGASLGEEFVVVISARAGEVTAGVERGEKSGIFEHPHGASLLLVTQASSLADSLVQELSPLLSNNEAMPIRMVRQSRVEDVVDKPMKRHED